MIETWAESSRFDTISQKLADQVRILKKGRFSNIEIQEICKHINSKEYEKDPRPESKH